ncbi:MAG: hypothetical protein EOO15_13325 [Chitinophagaceae bacterium]|nr:MAG: hypothetical protein EOO15_13325 [Chitinophagaceae bacterium]
MPPAVVISCASEAVCVLRFEVVLRGCGFFSTKEPIRLSSCSASASLTPNSASRSRAAFTSARMLRAVCSSFTSLNLSSFDTVHLLRAFRPTSPLSTAWACNCPQAIDAASHKSARSRFFSACGLCGLTLWPSMAALMFTMIPSSFRMPRLNSRLLSTMSGWACAKASKAIIMLYRLSCVVVMFDCFKG